MTAKKHFADHTVVSERHQDLRLRDNKRRKIGLQITIVDATVVDASNEFSWLPWLEPYPLGTVLRL
ncbi:MAG: hypothetical protein K0U16_07130, partial [Gammaproteobacteria bacterium]|nr:hypothetical protein [Gammaproteobacteria bacterium]